MHPADTMSGGYMLHHTAHSVLFGGAKWPHWGGADLSSFVPQPQHQPRNPSTYRRRQSAQLTSVAMSDNFDAMTTDVPTEWNAQTIGDGEWSGVEGRDYEESVSGYRNYVNEMERMLSGLDEQLIHSPVKPPSSISKTNGYRKRYNSEVGRGSSGVRGGFSGAAVNGEVREVTGRKGAVELVEHRIMEDGPQKTISLWRERVAQSSTDSEAGYGVDKRSDTNSGRLHHRKSSVDAYLTPESSRGPSSGSVSGKGKTGSGSSMRDYERSEYIIQYQHSPVASNPVYTISEKSGPAGGQLGRRGSVNSARPPSPTVKRTTGRSYERTEYMVAYPDTPPYSDRSSSNPGRRVGQNPASSPAQSRSYILPEREIDTSSVVRATSTSTIELILSSCEPSLLHITPVLTDLGILKVEHLRAVARLSEETRDRELKEQALKQGVTLMEWAILLDKIQTL